MSAIKEKYDAYKNKRNQTDGGSELLDSDGQQDGDALIPHTVSLDRAFLCKYTCPKCEGVPCLVAAKNRRLELGGLTKEEKEQGHRECWCKANDDIEATRRWRVNSQLLEAAHNGSLSKPMKRQGKQGTSTRHNLFASDDGDLRKWMEKHLKPPPAAALEEGLTREEVNAHEAAGHAIADLLLFLHVLGVTDVEDLPNVSVEVVTFVSVKFVIETQEQLWKKLKHDVDTPPPLSDKQQKAENRKRLEEETTRKKEIDELGKSDQRKRDLRLMRRELKKKLELEQVLDHLIEKRADPNVFDRNGITALHYAARNGNYEDIRLLLDYDANPLIADVKGNSVLHFAAMYAPSWRREDDARPADASGCELCGSRHDKKHDPCPFIQALRVLKAAYVRGLAAEGRKVNKSENLVCKNSTGRTPKDLLTLSVASFEEEAKKLEKDRKKGGDFFDSIATLLDGIKGLDTEEQFLKYGHEHTKRVNAIANNFFSKNK